MWRPLALASAGTVLVVRLSASSGQTPPREISFSKDVAPIVYAHCVRCHRPGEIAPFSMLTYKETRPWARSIRLEVLTRGMPPWFADPRHGVFSNSRLLADQDVQTLVAWVDGGAKEGNPADLPPAPRFDEGWQIGTPDLIVTMTEPYKIPAAGTAPQVSLPTSYVFPEDTWVQAIEVRPGNRRVVHQSLVRLGTGGSADGLHLYAPGLKATVLREGYARFIPRGTRIHLQMHYVTIGQEAVDQSHVGFKFAAAPVHTEVRTGIAEANSSTISSLLQPHQAGATLPLPADARIHALRVHMPIRGRNATAALVFPDGLRKMLLSIDGWTDDWEYDYIFARPEEIPPGTLLEYKTIYDNPDPKSPQQTHLLYFDWTEVNARNRKDMEPIREFR